MLLAQILRVVVEVKEALNKTEFSIDTIKDERHLLLYWI
jgi:hypothetical protein